METLMTTVSCLIRYSAATSMPGCRNKAARELSGSKCSSWTAKASRVSNRKGRPIGTARLGRPAVKFDAQRAHLYKIRCRHVHGLGDDRL